MYALELKNIKKSFGKETPLKNVQLNLAPGEIGCLVGPSGCGKSTLLRLIAGLDNPDNGTIKINGQTVFDKDTNVPPYKRGVGMIFQDYSLFSNMTVYENVAFGKKKIHLSDVKENICEILVCFQIYELKDKYPHELSGGQQQRVALARAFANKTNILLMDEPFSNLDIRLKDTLLREIKKIIKTYKMTTLMVTHSMEEAFRIADKVGVLNDGRLIQWASPYEIYHRPADKFTASFSGDTSYLNASVFDNTIRTILGQMNFNNNNFGNGEYDLLVRPEDIIISDSGTEAKVISKEFMGATTNYEISLENNEKLLIRLPSHYNFSIGDTVRISGNFKHIVIFDKQIG